MKVMELVEIATSSLAVFETSVSKALNDGEVDEREFATLQTFQLGVLNELASVYHKMEAKTRAHSQKNHTGKDQRPQEEFVRDVS